MLSDAVANELLQSLHYVGIPARKEDLMANNPQFKPSLLLELQKQQHYGYQAPNDDIYGQSSLFRGGNWRDRKQGRLGNDGDGGFADNLEEEDPMRRRMTKTSIVADGLFSAHDMKGEGGDQNKTTLPGGLFDDSDEEKELKKEMKKVQENMSSMKQVSEPPKKADLFAIEEDDDDVAYLNKQKEEEKKKIAKKLLGDSDDEDEFKPQLRKPSVMQAPPMPPQPPAPKKQAFLEDSDEESFKPAAPAKTSNIPKPLPVPEKKKVAFDEDDEDEDIGFKKPPVPAKPQPGIKKTTPNFLDDDDDDDDFKMPGASKITPSKRPPSISMKKDLPLGRKKSVLLDDEDDEDDFDFKKPAAAKPPPLPSLGKPPIVQPEPPKPKEEAPPAKPQMQKLPEPKEEAPPAKPQLPKLPEPVKAPPPVVSKPPPVV